MQVRAFKAEGLAQLTYLASGTSEAFLVDPQRDTDAYLQAASALGVRIAFVLETHGSDDTISGSSILAELLDIPVYHGRNREAPSPLATELWHGDEILNGCLRVTVLETPGYSNDSVCFQVADTNVSDEVLAVFSGDTLIVNEIGRANGYPDDKAYISPMLHKSLSTLLGLSDDVIVYPAHGAGSVCCGGLAERQFTTLGDEKRFNPRLQFSSRAMLEKAGRSDHCHTPYIEQAKHEDAPFIERPLTRLQGERWRKLLLSPGRTRFFDIRTPLMFSKSSNGGIIPHDNSGSPFTGQLLDANTPVVLLAESHCQAREAASKLRRLGCENIIGFTTELPAVSDDSRFMQRQVSAISALYER